MKAVLKMAPGFALGVAVLVAAQLSACSKENTESQSQSIPSASALEKYAVRIQQRNMHGGDGSGVLIKKQGSTYTVATNAHVVTDAPSSMMIVTSDGRKHSYKVVMKHRSYDLAIVEFSSSASYPVARVRDSSKGIAREEKVTAIGFPVGRWASEDIFEPTAEEGFRALVKRQGRVKEFTSRNEHCLGYRIGVSAEVDSGMSGGPVFDGQGLLIGLNGLLADPISQALCPHFESDARRKWAYSIASEYFIQYAQASSSRQIANTASTDDDVNVGDEHSDEAPSGNNKATPRIEESEEGESQSWVY